MNLAFVKKKKFYIPAIIVLLLVGFISYGQYKKAHQPPVYELVKVERGDLTQTVEATGKIDAVDDLSLRFEIPGNVGAIPVKEGMEVKKGQLLASLKLNELNAAVSQAKANLDKQLAGATQEDRNFYASAVDSAKASLDQAKIDVQNSVSAAQAAADTAQNNLKIAEGGDDSQIVSQAYANAVATLQSSLLKLDDALTQADNILGLDNTLANESFRQYLSKLDESKINQAFSSYTTAKATREAVRSQVAPLVSTSDHQVVDQALNAMQNALSQATTLLLNVSETLRATAPIGTLTQASLDAKKAIIETTRGSVATQYAAVITQSQALVNAKNSLTTYTIAYQKAMQDLEKTKANVDNLIKIKQAAYNQALANYQGKINPPRSVDVASYRASLAQAVASRDKAFIFAPIDGIVTKLNKKVGELVSSADVMVSLLSPHYEVKVDISEVDVGKIKTGNDVTITLDAFGTDTKLTGKVISIEPGPTVIQDVVYYKVRVGLDDTKVEIKPGMTANVSIKTDSRQGVLFLPSRAIKYDEDGARYVKVLEQNVEKEYSVHVGLKANEGKIEIVDGLNQGQEVILSKK
jgi:RND family efflux transporter MFP subunit